MLEISSKESMYMVEGGPDVAQLSFVLDKMLQIFTLLDIISM